MSRGSVLRRGASSVLALASKGRKLVIAVNTNGLVITM
jgi:hypothetical protein